MRPSICQLQPLTDNIHHNRCLRLYGCRTILKTQTTRADCPSCYQYSCRSGLKIECLFLRRYILQKHHWYSDIHWYSTVIWVTHLVVPKVHERKNSIAWIALERHLRELNDDDLVHNPVILQNLPGMWWNSQRSILSHCYPLGVPNFCLWG